MATGRNGSSSVYRFVLAGLIWIASLVGIWQWSAAQNTERVREISREEVQKELGPINDQLSALNAKLSIIYDLVRSRFHPGNP